MIQNADDAGAKVVRFYIDNRQHGISSCINERLAQHQGPALIAFNDAVFTEKDWEGIQQLQDSIKADNPFNVGKYGIGFNSVYHITGVYHNDLIRPGVLLLVSLLLIMHMHGQIFGPRTAILTAQYPVMHNQQ